MTKFTVKQRENLTEKKMAMPDGSYPIRNRSDLKNAISSYGRAKDKEAIKKWIIRRARELNSLDLIPNSWRNDIKQVAEKLEMTEDLKLSDNSEYLIHYGVLGMKWGVRKAKKYAKKAYQSSQEGKAAASKSKEYRKEYTTRGIPLQKEAATLRSESAQRKLSSMDYHQKSKSSQSNANKYASKAEYHSNKGHMIRARSNSKKAKQAQNEANKYSKLSTSEMKESKRLGAQAESKQAEADTLKQNTIYYKQISNQHFANSKAYIEKVSKTMAKFEGDNNKTLEKGRKKIKRYLDNV